MNPETTIARSWGAGPASVGPVDVTHSEPGDGTWSWQIEMLSTTWVPADDVHGDRSDGWAIDVDTYLAVDVRYTAGQHPVHYSALDWTFDTTDHEQAIPGTAGGNGPEEARALPPAGILEPRQSLTGRVYFGFTGPTSGTLTYATLTDGVQGTWWIPRP